MTHEPLTAHRDLCEGVGAGLLVLGVTAFWWGLLTHDVERAAGGLCLIVMGIGLAEL